MTNVGRRYTKSSHTSPEEDIPRLEADFQRFFVADPKASQPPTREIFDLYREGTDAHTPSHSFREFQEASLRRLSSTNATFKWPAVRHSFDEERHMIRRPDSNLSTTSFRNEAWNSSASRFTSTIASEYTTPISKTGSIGESVRNDLGGYQEVHAINASEMYEGGVPNFRKRKELFDDSDASPSPTLSYRGSQFSPTAVAQQQIGCQHYVPAVLPWTILILKIMARRTAAGNGLSMLVQMKMARRSTVANGRAVTHSSTYPM
ncbi:hypothetical protein C8R42DRAFT_641291 [Lentinula raphanica]|nr:hypothetical protein C8R42DRAFT_641291 [Lentinula raphanica]